MLCSDKDFVIAKITCLKKNFAFFIKKFSHKETMYMLLKRCCIFYLAYFASILVV